MVLLVKKLGGLALTLLGGLTIVHGAVVSAAWEVGVGLAILAMGIALLAMKVVRRNTSEVK